MKLAWVYFRCFRRDYWTLVRGRGYSRESTDYNIVRGRRKFSVQFKRATVKTFRSLKKAKAYAEVCYRMGVHKNLGRELEDD